MCRLFVVLVLASVSASASAEKLRAAERAGAAAARAAALPTEEEFVGCKRYPDSKRFRWSMRGEVGVAELVASVGEIGCRAMVVNPQLATRAGKVVLEVPDLLSAHEVYRLFLSSLDVMGLTIEVDGNAWKIVDSNRGREVSKPMMNGALDATGDAWVTRLMRLKHARPAEILPLVDKLRSKEGEVAAFTPTSSILITDRAGNVRRIEEIVAALDQPRAQSSDRLFLIAAHRQSATELVAATEKILGATRRGEAPAADAKSGVAAALITDGVTALVPLETLRALVLVGSDAGYARTLALLQRIDPPLLPSEEQTGQAHVVYLEHTNAEDLLQTLGQLGLGGRGGGGMGAPRPQMPGAPIAAVGSGTTLSFTGEVKLAADKTANAVVVVAGSSDFALVRDLISRLDVPRRQVYVEVTILDVTVDRARELGLSFHNTFSGPAGSSGVVANSSTSNSSLVLNASTAASMLGGAGVLGGLIGPMINVAGQSLPSFGVILKALETSRDVHVLSRPHLLTLDHIKSSISVGQTFPYQSASVGAAGTGTSVVSTYGRQEVQLKLEMTPHLNHTDGVRLELSGEISDVPDQAGSSPGGPITNKRTITTSVEVHDGEVVVLGGLQKESSSDIIEKVPFLGDIPLLGRLFQSRTKQRIQQDLLIILQPHVIHGPEDLRRISQRREEEERELSERFDVFAKEDENRRVEYAKRPGVLDEIDRASRRAEVEATAVAAARLTLRHKLQEGVVEAVAAPDGEPRGD